MVQAVSGTFPDAINLFKKDASKLSEGDKVILKDFVETIGNDKGIAKCMWSSIADAKRFKKMP